MQAASGQAAKAAPMQRSAAGNKGCETDSGAVLMQLPGCIQHSVLKQFGNACQGSAQGLVGPLIEPGQKMFPKWKDQRANLSPDKRFQALLIPHDASMGAT